MDTIEATELIEKVFKLKWDEITSTAGSKIIADVYKVLFNSEVCQTCKGDVRNAYYAIRNHTLNPHVIKPVMEKSNFQIKNNGIIIDRNDENKMYSNDNLTDAIAEKLLTENPALAVRFSVIPESFPLRSVVSKETHEVSKTAGGKDADETSLIEMAIAEVNNETDRAKLVKVAEENGYPKNEYQKKDLKQLKKYIISKLQSA